MNTRKLLSYQNNFLRHLRTKDLQNNTNTKTKKTKIFPLHLYVETTHFILQKLNNLLPGTRRPPWASTKTLLSWATNPNSTGDSNPKSSTEIVLVLKNRTQELGQSPSFVFLWQFLLCMVHNVFSYDWKLIRTVWEPINSITM